MTVFSNAAWGSSDGSVACEPRTAFVLAGGSHAARSAAGSAILLLVLISGQL